MVFGKGVNTKYSYDFDIDYSYLAPTASGNRELESLFFALAERIESENLNDAGKAQTFADIPICIFRQGISGLQAIVKYLKEEKNLSYAQISRQISRDQRTIWATYSSVRDLPRLKKIDNDVLVSTAVFYSRKFSVLESLAVFLKDSGYALAESGRMLGKSPKTIWTVLSRAEKKRAKNNG